MSFEIKSSEAVVAQAAPVKFGLNQNAVLLSLTYNSDCRGDNSTAELPIEACDMVFAFGEKEFSHRIMPLKGTYVKQVLDSSPMGVKKAIFEQLVQPLVHLFEALGVSIPAINSAIAPMLASNSPLSFKAITEKFITLLPKSYATIKLDLFLQYEATLRESATRTYLKVPKDLKSGLFIVAAMEGEYTEVRKATPTKDDPKALYYTREDGTEHKFTRNGYYVTSKVAQLQSNDVATPANVGTTAVDISQLKY